MSMTRAPYRAAAVHLRRLEEGEGLKILYRQLYRTDVRSHLGTV